MLEWFRFHVILFAEKTNQREFYSNCDDRWTNDTVRYLCPCTCLKYLGTYVNTYIYIYTCIHTYIHTYMTSFIIRLNVLLLWLLLYLYLKSSKTTIQHPALDKICHSEELFLHNKIDSISMHSPQCASCESRKNKNSLSLSSSV